MESYISINEKSKKRTLLITILIFVLSITLSGCGLPEEADFSDVEKNLDEEIDELDHVITEFDRLENTRSIYYCRYGENEGKWCVTDEKTSSGTVISESDGSYKDIIDFLANHDNCSIYRNQSGIIIEGITNSLDGNYCEILKSDETPENVSNPYWDAGRDIELMNWEKSVDGDKVTFIADHRKDKTSYHKGMYYRVDMKLVDRGIYIFETQVKYPWYSLFNG